MPAVVTEACIKCKYMDCVEFCCVDAFYEGENMLVINPRECVDCGVCIEECPADAIVWDTDPLAGPWMELNSKYSEIWPNVNRKADDSAFYGDEFLGALEKFQNHFSPAAGPGCQDGPHLSAPAKTCKHRPSANTNKGLVAWIRSRFRSE